MGVIHGLEGDSRVIAVEVAVLDQVLDRVNNLGMLVGSQEESMRHSPSSEGWLARGVLPTL